MKHIGLKITAFIFAIALWLYAISLKNYTVSIEVPLLLNRIPENLALSQKAPKYIDILVEGKAFDLIRLKNSTNHPSSISLDLQNALLGVQRFEINKENFNCPHFPNVHYLNTLSSPFVDLEFDTKITHTVPIKLDATIEIDSGYILMSEPSIEPTEVTLQGARNALTRIFEVQTQKVKYSKLRNNLSENLPLELGSIPSNIEVLNTHTQLNVKVQPVSHTQIDKIPVKLIGVYNRNIYKLEPSEASIQITGGKSILDSLSIKDIELFIEFNRFAIEDTDSLSPTIKIKAPIQSSRLQPEKFRLQKIETLETQP